MKSDTLHETYRAAKRRADIYMALVAAGVLSTTYLMIVDSNLFIVTGLSLLTLAFLYERARDQADRVHAAYRSAVAIEWGWARQDTRH